MKSRKEKRKRGTRRSGRGHNSRPKKTQTLSGMRRERGVSRAKENQGKSGRQNKGVTSWAKGDPTTCHADAKKKSRAKGTREQGTKEECHDAGKGRSEKRQTSRNTRRRERNAAD